MATYSARKAALELLTEANATPGKVLDEHDLIGILAAILTDADAGRELDKTRLTEIISQSTGVLSISTEGISNDDLDTLLILARKSS